MHRLEAVARGAGAVLFAAAAAAMAAGPDEQWEVTMKMEGMALPPQKTCVPKGQARDPSRMGPQQDGDCRTTDVQKSGNKMSWKMRCAGGRPMNGSGEIVYSGNDSYEGRMRMTEGGETHEIGFSGRRVGTCDAREQQAKLDPLRGRMESQQRAAGDAMRQQQALQAEQCRKAVENMDWKAVFPESSCRAMPTAQDRQQCIAVYSNPQVAVCRAQQPAMCGRIGALANDMRGYDGYVRVAGGASPLKGEWKDAFAACKIATPAQPACPKARNDKAWRYVGRFCPVETEAVAKAQCPAKRQYTAVERNAGELAYVCLAYWDRLDGGDGNVAEAPARAATPKPAAAAPAGSDAAASDVVTEGAKQLRKLLPF